jgi:hypothetical protein
MSTVTLTPEMTELPLEDQASPSDEVAHWICTDCQPNLQFGQVMKALCGAEELYDGEWEANEAGHDCRKCVAVGRCVWHPDNEWR